MAARRMNANMARRLGARRQPPRSAGRSSPPLTQTVAVLFALRNFLAYRAAACGKCTSSGNAILSLAEVDDGLKKLLPCPLPREALQAECVTMPPRSAAL